MKNSSKGGGNNDKNQKGHRDRMRQLFKATPQRGLPDYMLLEMLLYNIFPRGDTKPLAKELLNRFPSFAQLLNAPPEAILEVKGAGESVVNYFRVLLDVFSRLHLGVGDREIHVLNNWSSVVNYCQLTMGFAVTESLRILYLNKRNILIADEEMQRGTIDKVSIFPREIVKKALQHSAAAVIMVHNHPSGDPTPSQADMDMTEQVSEVLSVMNMRLHDHLICAGAKTYSFRANNLLA